MFHTHAFSWFVIWVAINIHSGLRHRVPVANGHKAVLLLSNNDHSNVIMFVAVLSPPNIGHSSAPVMTVSSVWVAVFCMMEIKVSIPSPTSTTMNAVASCQNCPSTNKCTCAANINSSCGSEWKSLKIIVTDISTIISSNNSSFHIILLSCFLF